MVDFTLLEPLGVTAHIVPWNYPLGMAIRSLAPALAAGCTAVLKPAEQSPLIGADARPSSPPRPGFPAGVLNVVTGFGEEAGDALVRHPLVRGITFTGSVETGRHDPGGRGARHQAGRARARRQEPGHRLRRRRSRTGWSSDAAPTAPSATPARSARLPAAISCIAKIRDEFLDRALQRTAAKLTVGPGLDDPDLGPIVSDEQYAKVTGYVAEGTREGARLRHRRATAATTCSAATSSRRPSSTASTPTPASRARRSSARSASRSTSPTRTRRCASPTASATASSPASTPATSRAPCGWRSELEAGSVWINGWFIGGQQAPTGGIKDSGIGRERGLPGIRNYLQIKNVAIRL